jgi:hypothetical protein
MFIVHSNEAMRDFNVKGKSLIRRVASLLGGGLSKIAHSYPICILNFDLLSDFYAGFCRTIALQNTVMYRRSLTCSSQLRPGGKTKNERPDGDCGNFDDTAWSYQCPKMDWIVA